MELFKQASQLPSKELATNVAVMAGLTTVAIGGLLWCVQDYQDFLALGPGGAAYNVKGWAWVTLLRPFALSRSGAKQVSSFPTNGAHDDIQRLSERQGERASVGGIIPHRQLSQHSPKELQQV